MKNRLSLDDIKALADLERKIRGLPEADGHAPVEGLDPIKVPEPFVSTITIKLSDMEADTLIQVGDGSPASLEMCDDDGETFLIVKTCTRDFPLCRKHGMLIHHGMIVNAVMSALGQPVPARCPGCGRHPIECWKPEWVED